MDLLGQPSLAPRGLPPIVATTPTILPACVKEFTRHMKGTHDLKSVSPPAIYSHYRRLCAWGFVEVAYTYRRCTARGTCRFSQASATISFGAEAGPKAIGYIFGLASFIYILSIIFFHDDGAQTYGAGSSPLISVLFVEYIFN